MTTLLFEDVTLSKRSYSSCKTSLARSETESKLNEPKFKIVSIKCILSYVAVPQESSSCKTFIHNLVCKC